MSIPTRGEIWRGHHAWDILRLAVLASPLAVLVLLMWHPDLDPLVKVPGFHFGIVTLAAGTSALVALAVLAVAEHLQDPRAFFLGLAFCAIAGFFFIHGLLTPGVLLAQASNGIGWAPVLGVFLGSGCLALSTVRQRPGREPWVFRHRKPLAGLLLALWAAFLTLSVEVPRFLDGHPTSLAAVLATHAAHQPAVTPETPATGGLAVGTRASRYEALPAEGTPQATLPAVRPSAPRPPWIAGALLAAGAGLLLFAALRYAYIYRLSRLMLHEHVIVGIVLLLESLVPLSLGTVWRLSWWGYHVLILAGVATILSGMLLDYRRGASLSQTISALLLQGSVETIERSYSEVITGLVAAVEARDPYTKGHSEKVARLAVRIGEALGLPPERLRVLHQAGLVHDIGKIGIPDGILNKPGRLTPAEVAVVREHPLRSEEMLNRIPSLKPTLQAVRWHHERLDGSGYPDGLAGDAIPLDARIVAVADVFDAMTSGRSYRTACPLSVVLAHLQQEAGRLYDPRCVEAIARIATLRPEEPAAGWPALEPLKPSA